MASSDTLIRTTFHVDLSSAYPNETYRVRAHGRNLDLHPHTAQTRAAARARSAHLAAVHDNDLTHYTTVVDMPADVAMRVHTKHSATHIAGLEPGIAVPSMAALFVPPAQGNTLDLMISHKTTAMLLAFSHPDLITQNPAIARVIWDEMTQNRKLAQMFVELGNLMKKWGKPSTTQNAGWATLVRLHEDPNPSVSFPDPSDPDGPPVSYPGIDSYFMNPNQGYLAAAGPVQTKLLIAIKNKMVLQGKNWAVTYGSATVPADAPAVTPDSTTKQRAAPTPPAARLEAKTDGDDWNVALTTSERNSGLKVTLSDIDPENKRFTVTFADNYIRYLGYYAIFYDAEGNKLSLKDWTPDGEDTNTSLTYELRRFLGPIIEYDDVQFIGYSSGVTTVLAVPTVDGTLELSITMPEGAVAAEFFGSGLGLCGSLPYEKTPLFGGGLTVLVDLVIPAVMLARSAYSLSNATTKAEINKLLRSKWKFAAAQLIYYLGDALYGLVTDKKINWSDLIKIATVLFKPVSFELLLFLEAKMAVEEAAEEVPFAGWVLFALQLSVGIAQTAETIVEIATSPWTIPVGVRNTITSTVSVYPDPRAGGAYPYPSQEATLNVTMTYKAGKRPAVVSSQTVAANHSGSGTLVARFPNNTLGGQIKVDVKYYVGTWAAAQASSGWMDNTDADAAEITVYLVENPIPLDENSVYTQQDVLIYADGAYSYQTTDSNPTATVASSNSSSSGNAISVWRGLSLSQRYGALGYAWQAAGMGIPACNGTTAGQLNAMQNVNIPGTDMNGVAFPACGFIGPGRMFYDPYPPKFLMENGQWVLNDGVNPPAPVPDPSDEALGDYYLDPRKRDIPLSQGGGYHLRLVDLSGNQDPDVGVAFDTSTDQLSYGRFQTYPSSLAMHPAGYAIGVDSKNCKLSILELSPAGLPDVAAPQAINFAGAAMSEQRVGLLFRPVGVTCSYDGTILVLEATKGGSDDFATIPAVARIQTFDVSGNSVARFKDAEGNPTPFLRLEGVGEYTYLDVCAVGDTKMTYIYVLYYTGNGHEPSDYHMSIYQYGEEAPASNPLVTSDGVAAAALFVDMWHQMYTLNYAMTSDAAGHASGPKGDGTGPAGRTVPAIGQWLPPFPTATT